MLAILIILLFLTVTSLAVMISTSAFSTEPNQKISRVATVIFTVSMVLELLAFIKVCQ